MKKNVIFSLLLLLGSSLSFGQGFYIDGTNLKDANGNNFIMKGLNVPLAWYIDETNSNIEAIGNVTGANCLRIVVETGTPDNAWQTAVEKCIENNMIPMVELHSVTGSNDTEELHDMAEWWASKASFLTRPDIARYILINIANEWGDWYLASPNHSPSVELWRETNIRCINTIRDAGINTTLVVDAPGYGQDNEANAVLTYGSDILSADPENNILFSIHMYCEWAKDGNSDVATDLPAVKNAGLPVIVGEFGFQHATDGSCDIDEELIMSTGEENEIGWLAWSWTGNSGGVEYLDMAEEWDGSVLSDWGNTVINSENGTKTAETASIFGSADNQEPVVSITSPENDAVFPSSSEVTIEVLAEDVDGNITGVEFYSGSELLHTDTEAPYTYTWSNAEDSLYELVAMANDNDNGVAFSEPVSIRVGAEPAPENQITNNEFDDGTSGWSVDNTDNANGSISTVSTTDMSGNNALEVCATNPGTENWHVQVLHNVAFEAGEKYEISFMAKAEEDRALDIAVQQVGGSWTTYYSESMNLTTSAQNFNFTFEPDVTDESAQFKFLTGLSDACVYIDDVVFKEVSVLTSVNDFSKNNNSVFPNPFENSFRVKTGKGSSEITNLKLLNLSGQCVFETEISTGEQDIIVPQHLPSGMYMLLLQQGDNHKVIQVHKK